MFFTFLSCAVFFDSTRLGRPVARSIPVDQFIGTNGSARITSPVARSMGYAKPLRSKGTRALRVCPFIGRAPRKFSFSPSQIHLCGGVPLDAHTSSPVSG